MQKKFGLWHKLNSNYNKAFIKNIILISTLIQWHRMKDNFKNLKSYLGKEDFYKKKINVSKILISIMNGKTLPKQMWKTFKSEKLKNSNIWQSQKL